MSNFEATETQAFTANPIAKTKSSWLVGKATKPKNPPTQGKVKSAAQSASIPVKIATRGGLIGVLWRASTQRLVIDSRIIVAV